MAEAAGFSAGHSLALVCCPSGMPGSVVFLLEQVRRLQLCSYNSLEVSQMKEKSFNNSLA